MRRNLDVRVFVKNGTQCSSSASDYYQFHGAKGKVRWPQKSGIGLSSAGFVNFIVRLGLAYQLTSVLDEEYTGILFVDLDVLNEDEIAKVGELILRERRMFFLEI